jgi:hypothetical protein
MQRPLDYGDMIRFTHPHTYDAPSGATLTGILVGITFRDTPGCQRYTFWSNEAGVDYGLPLGSFEIVEQPACAADRLANIERANAQHRGRLATRYANWRAMLDRRPDYHFYPLAVAALRVALREESVAFDAGQNAARRLMAKGA